MTATTSACVDCGTPIIGDQLRCPACEDRHAANLDPEEVSGPIMLPEVDDAATAPRRRMPRDTVGLLPSFLVAWIVISELIAIAGLASIFAVKACT